MLKAGESGPKNPYQAVGVTVLLMSCTIGVLILFLYMTFKGDKGAGYASIRSDTDDDASRVILVKGSDTPPPYASYLALFAPPPPLYAWDTALPNDAYGILDPRDTYTDPAEWDEKARHLAVLFIKNFEKFTDDPRAAELVAAGPQL